MRSDELKAFDEGVRAMIMRYPLHFGMMLGVTKHYEYLPGKVGMSPEGYFAATWIEGNRVHMEITRKFLEISSEEQAATIAHELEHLLRKHLERITVGDSTRNKKLWGIATDIAINQDIKNLPDGVLTLERFNAPTIIDENGVEHEGYNMNLPRGLSSEEYYELLKQKADEQGEGEGDGEGDLESESDMGCSKPWEELTEFEKQKAHEVVKKLVEDAVDFVKRVGTGLGSYAGMIENDWLSVPNPWKSIIDRFVASTRSPESLRTWHKTNRHNGEWKGVRRLSHPTLLLVMDTSGSVQDQDIEMFLGHINHIRKTGTEVWVMQCDYGIQSIEKWDGNKPFQVLGRGGTSFIPPFEWLTGELTEPVVEQRPARFDGVIYLTDGYGECPAVLPVQTLWGLTKDGHPPREGLWTFELP